MKTLMIYEDGFERTYIYLFDGDYRRLNDIFINGGPPCEDDEEAYDRLAQELSQLIYDEEFRTRTDLVEFKFPLDLSDLYECQGMDRKVMIRCGMLP